MLEQVPVAVNYWTEWYAIVGYVVAYLLGGVIAGRIIAASDDGYDEDTARVAFLAWPFFLAVGMFGFAFEVATWIIDTLLGIRK